MFPTLSILSFWFPSNDYQSFWFDGSKDDEILEKYKEALTYCKNGDNVITNDTTNDEKLASIIVLDQFSRSIHRNNDTYSFMEDTEIAHKLSYSMIVEGADEGYPISRRLFILMPYRHLAVLTNNSDLLDVVISKLDEYEKECGSSSLIQRFRNATYQNFSVTTDRIIRYRYDNPSGTIHDYNDVLDPLCKIQEISLDESRITSLPLYQTMKRFFTSSSPSTTPNIGVSLSGGVDSMVILYIVKALLFDKYIKSVYALHLSYMFSDENDNKESEQSKNLIAMYCSLLNIPLYTRMIPYVREKTDRLFYEHETKSARFASYRYLSKKHNIEGWCLGHHHGDVGENVMMNLCNGRSLLELKVMDKTSRLYDVTLYRPFLDHPKTDIYDFAHKFSIPYLKDTTPDWACRGVLRRKVFPPLIDQYPALLHTLENISNESYEWKMVVEQFVIEPIKRDIAFDLSKKTATMTLRGVLPKVVWSSVFLYIFHTMSINMISHKNVSYFCDMYQRNLLRKNRFMFSNNCVGIFMENRDNASEINMMLRIVRLNEK